ncbi:PQQ-binding-like beta-propeller repeat protein [Chloroflexales bacterium ZM16-3]|nr:PQQ-binding-like beta-propeller repeat protein [Chloroflexales bacterium ZM16-3]
MMYAYRRSTTALIALAIIATTLAFITPTHAGARDQPDPLPGWTHSPRYPDDTSDRHGLVLSGGRIEAGSPVIAEVDGNTANGQEVVIGGSDGRLYAYHANGTLLWQKDVPNVGCASGVSLINSKPSVGAIFGGSTPYVLIGYGAMVGTNRACDGGVVAYRGTDGQMAWNFSQRTYDDTVTPEGPEALYGVITTPALGDADGDGTLEVAFGGLDRNLYMLNSDGSVRWYYHAADTIWATPLFMNIDSDAALELIAPTDISANPNIIPPTSDGGFIHAFNTQQRSPARIPFQTGYIWRTVFDQVIFSSPLAADVLSSNPGEEIAVGSGCYFPTSSTDKRGKWIKILRPSDGTVLQTLNAPTCVQSSPAVGDIDDDGELEIVATVSGDASIGGDGKSDIVAWDPTNPTPKWSTSTGDPNSGSNDTFGGDRQSAVIADLDGNGSLEVIAANFWSVHVLRGKDGVPLTCQSPSCGDQISLFAWGTLKSTPAVGDINGDGKLDLVIGGMNISNSSHGHLYAWTDFAGVLGSSAGKQPAYSAPWPQLRRDAKATGTFSEPGISVSTKSLGTLIETNDTRAISLPINSADGTQISWTASVSSDANGIVTLTKASGSSGDAVQFTLDSSNLANGTYTASLTVASPQLSSIDISLSLIVVDTVYYVYTPLIVR